MVENLTGFLFALGLVDWFALVLVSVGVWYFFLRKNRSEYEFNSSQIKPIIPNGIMSQLSESGGFVNKMMTTGRHVVVFYGSQTGTAEDLANRLAKDAQRYGMKKGFALDPEECDVEELPKVSEIENSLVIFTLATYGEGDPTDNAQELHEFLQRGDADLTGVNYAVFGLGNKTYEHYNAMAEFVDKRMSELGAKRVYELGLGDDDGNLEEDFMLWREGFWPAVCDFFDIRTIGEDISTRQYKLTIHSPDEIDEDSVYTGEIARLHSYRTQKAPFDSKNPFLARVVANKELHSGGDRSCKHVEFDLTGSKLRYETGDHVAVYPTNDVRLVEKLGQLLNADLDTVITLTNVDEDSTKKHPFCCPCSYRTALTHYVDITTLPKTNVIKEIADYCTNPADKDFLLSMTSTKEESRKKFSDWIVNNHRTILDVLEDVPSCRPPLDHLLELLPRLQARYYSISSSPKCDPNIISVTAVVVQYSTKLGRVANGVATTFLSKKRCAPLIDGLVNADPDCLVPIFVRKSQLRLPHGSKTPVIMIGPGTGLAPFRGFLQERQYQHQTAGKEIGPTVLYFGCRNRSHDFLYKEELEQWLADGILTELHVAPSREQAQKVYVQHLLKKNKAETWRLLEKGAHVYVCGDAKNMSKDVMETFVDICQEEGQMSRENAQAFMKRMESQKRYQADVWS